MEISKHLPLELSVGFVFDMFAMLTQLNPIATLLSIIRLRNKSRNAFTAAIFQWTRARVDVFLFN